MSHPHVSDLTVDELKALVRETVEQALAEFLADPDQDLELRENMKAALEQSAKDVRERGAVYGIDDIDKIIKEKQYAEITFHATVKDGIIKLPREYKIKTNQRVRVIVSLENKGEATDTAIDRLLARPVRIKDFRPMTRNDIYAR